MSQQTGALTVYSADRSQIYAEFVDATWEVEDTDSGPNHIFTGTASQGTLDTFLRLDQEGISHVAYVFETAAGRYAGSAELLRPQPNGGEAVIRIESGVPPALS